MNINGKFYFENKLKKVKSLNNTIELLDRERIELNDMLINKSEYSQYLTPVTVARFMASLFDSDKLDNPNILDAGAGIGTLTAALLETLINEKTSSIDCTLVEVDEILGCRIKSTLSPFKDKLNIESLKISEDFIAWGVDKLDSQLNLFNHQQIGKYTHAILNPPYKKIRSNSLHRRLLRSIGIETVNLYSAFVALTIKLLADGGQIVAIIPRSFCNGPYYRSFRELILKDTVIKHLHLFESRNKAFKDDEVLQENVIIMLERGGKQGKVKISTSTDASFTDYEENIYPFEQIVREGDSESFFHIPTSQGESIIDLFPSVKYSLEDLGISVSTGPVVSFRAKEHLRSMPEDGTVPMLYPTHIEQSSVKWIKRDSKKPNAIVRNEETEKMLYPNGFYTIIRRFSAKEEKKRIISGVTIPEMFNSPVLGFDNGLNVLHRDRTSMQKELAFGLYVYLSSTLVDKYFRLFNGHTQVNATDLRAMYFPSIEILTTLGDWYLSYKGDISQDDIDIKLEEVL